MSRPSQSVPPPNLAGRKRPFPRLRANSERGNSFVGRAIPDSSFKAGRYNYVTGVSKRTAAMVDLMSFEEQVDMECAAARRRARIRGLRAKVRKQSGIGTLLSFEEQRRSRRAYGGVRRGRDTVELSRTVASAGKHDWFDEGFMPLRSRERWKRMDRAFRLGQELPPVVLYKLGDVHFVEDG